MMKERLFALLESKKDMMVAHRRHLHMYPELSFEEKQTSQYILDFYKDKDVLVQANVGGYGIKVTIDSGKPGKTIALRADFDALPIEEDTGLSFASKNKGVMHACGHDGHTGYMMGLAESLIEMKADLTGKIVIIHQPAEEVPPGGAIAMIEDGVLEGVDHVLGIHFSGQVPLGIVEYHEGPTQAARAKFDIKVQGLGGHGAYPHVTHDALLAASALVVNLQTIVSRRTNPMDVVVLTVGSLDGKGQFNIIKDSVTLEGDVRMFSQENSELVEREMRAICDGIETMYHVKIDLAYSNDCPALYNDPKLTRSTIAAIEEANIDEVTQIQDCGMVSVSEDFAHFSNALPCCYFYIGAQPNLTNYPHHHPKFDIHEDALLIAAKTVGIALFNALDLR